MSEHPNILTDFAQYPLAGHTDSVRSVAWSPDGQLLASASADNTVRLWNGQTGTLLHTLEAHTSLEVGTSGVNSVAWSPDGQLLASGGQDNTVRLWNGQTATLLHTLEGHSDSVYSVAWSPDDHLLATQSGTTVCLRQTHSWETVQVIEEITTSYSWDSLHFLPNAHLLSALARADSAIRIWRVDEAALLVAKASGSSVRYTTAKIALVGDSGVGKSGLGYRIAKDSFRVTESTHGQQFWVVEKLGAIRSDNLQYEVVLWDFAGQPNFRPIHALFLDDVDLALVLFDPSRPDTLAGVDYWLKQLMHERKKPCNTILVAARTDVSHLSISAAELEAFCAERGISGGFMVTSAKSNEGIETLLEQVRQQIDWDAKPSTITTETFRRVKDYVLALKAEAERTHVLLNFAQLRSALEAIDADWQFSDAELRTAVGHLQNHGYVTILRRSSDEQSILLAPDLLINLASSFMLKAQANERGLGALEEARVLRNDYHFQEVEGLAEDERHTLLNAAVELFLSRNICFREAVDGQTFLIFPSLILERPPRLTENVTIREDVTYVVTGQVENVYAALVVLLGYSSIFQRMNQWRKQAQYVTMRGEVCGFKLDNDAPGELELVLYYDKATPDFVHSRFEGLFEEILHTRNVTAQKYAPVICPKCGSQQERRVVIKYLTDGAKFLFCAKDGRRISLKPAEHLMLNRQSRVLAEQDQVLMTMRTSYETALTSIKKVVQQRKSPKPSCFITYAWGDQQQESWVLRLAEDLRTADLRVELDQAENAAIGASIPRFIERMAVCDFILPIGTPTYLQKYNDTASPQGHVVAAEIDHMNTRLIGTNAQKASVLPLLLAGEEMTAFPPLLWGKVYANFKREADYFVALFDLLLTLYSIPVEHTGVRDLRQKLRQEAEGVSSKPSSKRL